MKNKEEKEDKAQESMKNRAIRLSLIEKLRSMGFTEQEIEYNFSKSDKDLPKKNSGTKN